MNRPLEREAVEDIPRGTESACDQVEDYLDHLCAPLLGAVPFAQRQMLRCEAREHLLAISEEFAQEQGMPPQEALLAAMREHGEPWQIGQSFLEAWREAAPRRSLARRVGMSSLRAFAFFGIATTMALLSLESYALKTVQPDSLPAILFLIGALPFLAGSLTGWTSPPQAARGTCRAMLLLILYSAIMSLLAPPHTEMGCFALFQLVFWLPIGCLSALATATLRQRYRRQHFICLAR